MKQQRQLVVRMPSDLYEMAMAKCTRQFGISLSSLIKIFLRSFVTQRGVGFYVGDDDLCRLFMKWFKKKSLMKDLDNVPYYAGPYLKDLFKLND